MNRACPLQYSLNTWHGPAANAEYVGRIQLINRAPLDEAMALIENGEGFRAIRDHFASLSPERQAQIRAEDQA